MAAPPAAGKSRPYWHVDLKWVFGIIFSIGFSLCLWLYALTIITSPQVALPAATHIVASMFSRNGLDDSTEIEQLKERVAQAPGDSFEPLPGISIPKSDLDSLSPRELRLKIFGQVVHEYYEKGPAGVAAETTSDPAQQEEIKNQAALFGLLNRQTHQSLRQALLVLALVLLLPLSGLVFFSYRLGRLVSPGLVLSLQTLPVVLLISLLVLGSTSGPAVSSGPIAFLPPEMVAQIAGRLLKGFLMPFGLGLTLLLGAVIGKAVLSRKKVVI